MIPVCTLEKIACKTAVCSTNISQHKTDRFNGKQRVQSEWKS